MTLCIVGREAKKFSCVLVGSPLFEHLLPINTYLLFLFFYKKRWDTRQMPHLLFYDYVLVVLGVLGLLYRYFFVPFTLVLPTSFSKPNAFKQFETSLRSLALMFSSSLNPEPIKASLPEKLNSFTTQAERLFINVCSAWKFLFLLIDSSCSFSFR